MNNQELVKKITNLIVKLENFQGEGNIYKPTPKIVSEVVDELLQLRLETYCSEIDAKEEPGNP